MVLAPQQNHFFINLDNDISAGESVLSVEEKESSVTAGPQRERLAVELLPGLLV